MNPTYFELTVPVFIKNLNNLKNILNKGWEAAQASGMSEEAFLNQSLAPDMFHLARQIQIATDNAKGAVARLTGTEPLAIEDSEKTVAELQARIDNVIAHLKTFTPEQFADAANKQVVIKYFPGKYQTGKDYFVDYAIPNFFFHCTIAYAIVRAQGVAIGKADFMGGLNLRDLA